MPQHGDVVRRLVRRFYDDMWNAFDVSVLDLITDPHVRFLGSLGDATVGRAELGAYVRKVQTAFPDFHNEVLALVVEGDTGFARLRYSGTHLGPLGEVAPTGRQVVYEGAAQFTVSTGSMSTTASEQVITEVWVLGDRVTLFQQLGVSAIG